MYEHERRTQMKKRILSLLLSLIMVLSLLPTTAWADWRDDWGFGGGSYPGTTTNTVDHIDINTTLQAKVVIDGKTYTQDVTFSWNDTQNGNLTITATQDEQPVTVPDYKYGGDGGDWSSPQVRLDANFPIGTKDNPVEYTLTLKKTLTINGVSVPVTLVVQVDYWSKLNICPGQDGYNKGIDVGVFETNSNTGSLSIQKTVTGVALTEAKTFDFTVSGNGETQTLRVTIPAGSTTEIVSTMLPYGTYTVTEDATSAGINGYTLTAPSAQSVTLSSQNKTSTVSFTNAYAEEITVGNLTIKKEVSGVKTGGKEFSFTVTNSDGTTVRSCAIKAGESHTFNNLPLGTYTVTESGADITGYDLTTKYNGEVGTSYDVTIGGTATQSGQTSRGIIGDIIDSVSSCGCGCEDCPCTRLICRCNSSCCDDCMCGGSTEQPDQPQPDQPSTPTTPSATVTVTNTYTQKTTNITVEKEWANVDGITLPASIQVQLYNGTTKVGDPVTLNAANGWKHTFENLPEYNGSTKINYTAKEVNVPTGFTSSENGLVITNTATRGEDINTPTSLTITKVDKDNANKKLAGAEFMLTKNGQTVATKTTDANGVATFTGLTEGTYTLTETKAPAGYGLDNTSKTIVVVKDSGTTALGEDNVYHTTYKHSVQDNADIGLSNGAMTIQNTRSTTSVTVTKAWVHNNVPTAQQPTSVTVDLMKNGNVKAGQATLSASNQWTHTFTNMYTHDDNGTLINYTVVENAVDGYVGEVTGNATTGFTITNTAQWADEKDNTATLTITKVDSEDATKKLTGAVFTLTLDNKTLTSVDNNNGTYTISGIDAAGNWTLTETKAPAGYEATAETRTVAVAESSEVNLVSVTAGETTVQKFQTENTYTITDNAEIDLSGDAITVTNNKLVDEPITVYATVTVTKYNDKKTETLKGAEFTLYNDKDEVVYTATTGDDGTCKFVNLTTGTYTLKETKAPTGYTKVDKTVEITVTENSTTEINNNGKFQTTTTYTASPATAEFVNTKILISVNVTKEWEDTDAESYRPESVTVQLYKNDAAVTDKTLELTKTNGWKGSFTNLPEYDGEDKNVYTVKEVNPSDSYTATVDTAANGYTITNSAKWSNEDAITGAMLTIKKVDSADSTKLLSGAKFTLTDKENLSNPMEATTDASGIASFTNLQPGTYMLEEVSAPVGYKENSQVWTVVVTQNETHTSVNKLADGTFQKVYDCTVTVSKDTGNDSAVLMEPNNDGSYTITNELAPTEYTAKVNIEKIVKKTGGNVAPGKEEFVFVAYYKGAEKNELVGEARIITDGVNTYISEMGLTVPASAFNLKDGNGEITLYVSEVKGSSAGWKYDDTVYTLVMTVENYVVKNIGIKVEISVFSIPDGQGPDGDSATVKLSFTNEFSQTKTPNRPHKPSKPITSVKTGDAGVAMYAMSGLLSLGGAALFMKKRKDEE